MKLAWRVGAVLLLAGGLLQAAWLLVGGLVSVSVATPASIGLYVVPATCIGAGLIAIGVSIRGRGRIPLMTAGVLNLGTVVVNIVQIATISPLGPAPSQLAFLVSLAAVVVAAALLLFNPSLHGSARWAAAIPAAGIVIFLVGVYVPPLGLARLDLLPGVGFAIAGVLLLRRTRPHLATAGCS